MTDTIYKTTVNFTQQNIDEIQYLHMRQKKSKSQVIRDSVHFVKVIQDKIDQGGKLIYEDAKGNMWTISP